MLSMSVAGLQLARTSKALHGEGPSSMTTKKAVWVIHENTHAAFCEALIT